MREWFENNVYRSEMCIAVIVYLINKVTKIKGKTRKGAREIGNGE
jgi:hypothetical protein